MIPGSQKQRADKIISSDEDADILQGRLYLASGTADRQKNMSEPGLAPSSVELKDLSLSECNGHPIERYAFFPIVLLAVARLGGVVSVSC